MLREVIILTEVSGNIIPDTPVCLRAIDGEPFLTYLIRYLLAQGIEKFIFLSGNRQAALESFLSERFATINYRCINQPINNSSKDLEAVHELVTEENVLLVKGNVLFKTDIPGLFHFHQMHEAECTAALKPMIQTGDSAILTPDEYRLIKNFEYKNDTVADLIPAGMYVLHVPAFRNATIPGQFTFERNNLETLCRGKRVYGFVQDKFFIDISTPRDYSRAPSELAGRRPDLKQADTNWALFLDRDGVINHEKFEEYILHKGEFRFLDGVLDAMKIVSEKFGHIILVTNQRGVGKGLMTENDLRGIHGYMQHAIESVGGRIDGIYYCTSAEKTNFNRKPNPGMALQAKKDFPTIDFSKSIMIGNKPTDMLFGRNAGMHTVFLATTNPEVPFPHPDIDFRFNSLIEFAKAL